MKKIHLLVAGSLLAWHSSFALAQVRNGTQQGKAPQGNNGTQPVRQPNNNPQGNPAQGNPAQGNPAQGNRSQPSGIPNAINNPAGNMQNGGQVGEQSPVNMDPQPRPRLSPEIEKNVFLWLQAWQKRTDAVERYACKFIRFEYNQSLSGNNFHKKGVGELKFLKPDKGVFKVEDLYVYQETNGKPDYQKSTTDFGPWWICNGESVFDFNRNLKEANEYELPPTMRGTQIAESPLPFVFGIEANKVIERYYVEPGETPIGNDNKPRADIVALDAYPKRLDDSLNYQRVTIYLNNQTILPIGMKVYLPESRPEQLVYELYEFSDVQVNSNLMDKVREKLFLSSFIPDPPKDYKINRKPYQPAASGAPQMPNQVQPGMRPNAPSAQPGGQRVAQPPVSNTPR